MHLTGATVLQFDDPGGKSSLADHHTNGEADQVGVVELKARTCLAIVQQYVDPGRFEFVMQFGRERIDSFLTSIQRTDHDLKRCDRHRPANSLVVVPGFDGSRHDSVHADAVAAHDHRIALAVGVEIGRVHRHRVLSAELEDMPNLDALLEVQRRAVRRPITLDSHANVG